MKSTKEKSDIHNLESDT